MLYSQGWSNMNNIQLLIWSAKFSDSDWPLNGSKTTAMDTPLIYKIVPDPALNFEILAKMCKDGI